MEKCDILKNQIEICDSVIRIMENPAYKHNETEETEDEIRNRYRLLKSICEKELSNDLKKKEFMENKIKPVIEKTIKRLNDEKEEKEDDAFYHGFNAGLGLAESEIRDNFKTFLK